MGGMFGTRLNIEQLEPGGTAQGSRGSFGFAHRTKPTQ
jgi:hypothetical protein